MAMNEWLSKVYGTAGSQEDLEKIAQAEMAQQLAQNEGLDLSHLNEEQMAALGNEVLGGGAAGGQPAAQGAPQPGAPEHAAAQPGAEGGAIDPSQIDPEQLTPEVMQQVEQVLANPELFRPEIVQEAQAIMQVVEQAQGQPQPNMAKTAAERVKEAEEKFEEADFLGRVMAHSFNQEIEKIAAAKQANAVPPPAAGGHLKHLGAAIKHHGGKAMEHVKHHAGAYGAAGGAAAGGAAGYALGHHAGKSKEASAIEAAAEKLAAEILAANGIDPQTLQPAQPAQPAAAPADPQVAAQQLVEKRAHQILNQLGFKVE